MLSPALRYAGYEMWGGNLKWAGRRLLSGLLLHLASHLGMASTAVRWQ